MDFKSVDAEPVYSVFLVVSPDDRAEEHVGILRWIATMARKADYTLFVRQTKSPREASGLLYELGGT